MVSRFDWWTYKTNGTFNKILGKHWRQDDTLESSCDIRKLSKALSFKTAYITPLKRAENRLATTMTTMSKNNDSESCSQASMYCATLIRETRKKSRILPKQGVITYDFLPITSSDALPIAIAIGDNYLQSPIVKVQGKGIQRSLNSNIHKLRVNNWWKCVYGMGTASY